MKAELYLILVVTAPLSREATEGSVATELTLQQAVELALERSPSLEALRAEVAGAEADVTKAKTYPFNPVVEAELGKRQRPLGTSTDARVGLVQEIEIRGQRADRIDSAQSIRDAAELQFEHERKLLIARVALGFAAALEARELARARRDDVALASNLAAVNTRRFEAGAISGLEASLPLVSLGKAEAEQEVTGAVYQVAQASLAEAIGVEGLAVPQDELTLPRRHESLSVGELVTASLARREDLLAYRALVLAAESRLEVARSAALSTISVGAFYNKEEGTDTILWGSVRLGLPLFDRNQGGIEAAHAEIRRMSAEAEAQALAVREQVLAAHARFIAAVAAVDHLEERVVGTLEDNLELLRIAYEAGKIGFGEILLFRRELVEARRAYVEAVAGVWRAAVVLDLAAGRVPIPERIQVN